VLFVNVTLPRAIKSIDLLTEASRQMYPTRAQQWLFIYQQELPTLLTEIIIDNQLQSGVDEKARFRKIRYPYSSLHLGLNSDSQTLSTSHDALDPSGLEL